VDSDEKRQVNALLDRMQETLKEKIQCVQIDAASVDTHLH